MKFEVVPYYQDILKGRGVEFGPAAHNPFGVDAVTVAPKRNFEDYKVMQVEMCGEYAVPDIWGYMEYPPFPDNSMDFVLSSHVIEHTPNPLRAIEEWYRILRPGGVMFMIFPHRNAHPPDRDRIVTPVLAITEAHRWGALCGPDQTEEDQHFYVYTLHTMMQCVAHLGLGWELILAEEKDQKVGNGHTLAYRKF